MSEETYAKPLPEPTALSRPFWEGTRAGQLLLQKCDACGAFRWTPQVLCRVCYAPEYTWTETGGRGTVYSFTIVHQPQTPAFREELPILIAIVELAEGPLMLTNLVGCAPEDVVVGMPVEVAFERATEEITLYKFRPAR